jgi:hypothetical protein
VETVPEADAFPAFSQEVEPVLLQAGVPVLATYATERSENTYPALPVREAEVFVWMAMFADDAERAERLAELERSSAWSDGAARAPAERLEGGVEMLRLTPTARSLVHG